MARFRKKPVEVEAVQWTGENADEVRDFIGSVDRSDPRTIRVMTIHGEVALARPWDWIIAEPKPGRFYPCKPDVFEATYEDATLVPVEATTAPDESLANPEAWRGEEPAEGTRRALVRDTILGYYVDAEGEVTAAQAERTRQVNAPIALELADRVEEALLGVEAAVGSPPEAAGNGDPVV